MNFLGASTGQKPILLGSAQGLDTPPARDPRRVHLVVDERVPVSKVPQGAYLTAINVEVSSCSGYFYVSPPGMVAPHVRPQATKLEAVVIP